MSDFMQDRQTAVTAAAIVVLAILLLGGVSIAFSGNIQF